MVAVACSEIVSKDADASVLGCNTYVDWYVGIIVSKEGSSKRDFLRIPHKCRQESPLKC